MFLGDFMSFFKHIRSFFASFLAKTQEQEIKGPTNTAVENSVPQAAPKEVAVAAPVDATVTAPTPVVASDVVAAPAVPAKPDNARKGNANRKPTAKAPVEVTTIRPTKQRTGEKKSAAKPIAADAQKQPKQAGNKVVSNVKKNSLPAALTAPKKK